MSEILIIGAGMAGLTCATRLAAAGRDVLVIDKGRGPGGRMAARRAEVAGETLGFDHGAQYFTARHPDFLAQVREWEAQGVVAKWPAAGEDAWVGTPGMNAPIRAMADKVAVNWSVRAESPDQGAINAVNRNWIVEVNGGEWKFHPHTVLLTVPAEQALDLLSGLERNMPDCPKRRLAEIPAKVRSEPCWAVMAAFAQPLNIEADCLRDAEAPISWAARNSAKPQRNGAETWVLHASPAKSREIINMPKEEAAEHLLAEFFAQTGLAPVSPIHLTAHRWLYAMPEKVGGEPAYFDSAARIGIAGDYLHSPRVEGAFLSGLALAERVLT
ncbi:MAG: FAD-dependent oxidoreductase [Pseudomonadota bacterium]